MTRINAKRVAEVGTVTGELKFGDVTERIIGIFYEVYNELRHGFLESVCEGSMQLALTQAGFHIRRQVPIDVWFRGHKVGEFFADLVVNGVVILELKAARAIDPAHEAQLLNYLRATTIEVGLLLNFGVKPDFKRLVFDNARKKNLLPPDDSPAPATPH